MRNQTGRSLKAAALEARLVSGRRGLDGGKLPSCNDGAAALVMMAEEARRLGLTPMARIVGYAGTALAPGMVHHRPDRGHPPPAVTDRMRHRRHRRYYCLEINEAFSAVSLAINRGWARIRKKVNVNGGAVALGHPIGATGRNSDHAPVRQAGCPARAGWPVHRGWRSAGALIER